MMVFFFSNMLENQLMSTGAFEITLNGNTFFFFFHYVHNELNSYLPVGEGVC